MEDAGFILGGYALTFGVIVVMAWNVLRRGRRLADQIPDDEKYWT